MEYFIVTITITSFTHALLGHPKHVLHLVWSAYFISTAVRTALKVARTPQILGERRPVSKNNKIIKRIDFEMGPSVKFVSLNKVCDDI